MGERLLCISFSSPREYTGGSRVLKVDDGYRLLPSLYPFVIGEVLILPWAGSYTCIRLFTDGGGLFEKTKEVCHG